MSKRIKSKSMPTPWQENFFQQPKRYADMLAPHQLSIVAMSHLPMMAALRGPGTVDASRLRRAFGDV